MVLLDNSIPVQYSIKPHFTCGQQRIVYASWTLSQNRWDSRRRQRSILWGIQKQPKKCCCVNHSKAHLQSQRDGGQSQVESGSAEPPEFVLDGDAGYGCLIWEIRKKRVSQSVGESFLKSSIVSVVRGCFKKKKRKYIFGSTHIMRFTWERSLCSPLSKAFVVPFKTSSVRAAIISACMAIAWALSTASAPREVIIWVPLMRAKPYGQMPFTIE